MAKVDLSGLDLEGLNALIEEATLLRDKKVEEKRAELIKQLNALDALTKPKGSSSPSRVRASPRQDAFLGPDGETWSGRGGVPKWGAKYGVTTREGMERFRNKQG